MKSTDSYFTSRSRTNRARTCLAAATFLVISFAILLAGKALPRTFDISDTSHLIYHGELSSGQGLAATAVKWADANIGPRFAPLFGVHGTLLAALFGLDLTARGIYYGLMFAACGILLFTFLRRSGFSFVPSFFLPLLMLIGPQSEIWWIDYGENSGMIFLALALFLAAMGQGRTSWRRGINDLLFTIGLVLMSLPKESFIMVIPAMLVLKVYGDLQADGSDPFSAVQKNLFPIAAGLALFLGETAFIVLKLGTQGAGYAGYEGFVPDKFFRALLQFIQVSHPYLLLSAAALAVWPPKKDLPVPSRRFRVWPAMLFALAVLAPCSLLYAKSGLTFGKYIVPGNMGIALLSAALLQRAIDSGRRKSVWIWAGAAVLTVVLQTQTAVRSAEAFSAESRRTDQVLELVRTRSSAEGLTVIVADPVRHCEAAYAFKEHLNLVAKRPEVYLWPLARKQYNEFDKSLVKYTLNVFKNKLLVRPDDAVNCFVVMPGAEPFLLRQTADWLAEKRFERLSFKGYVIYARY